MSQRIQAASAVKRGKRKLLTMRKIEESFDDDEITPLKYGKHPSRLGRPFSLLPGVKDQAPGVLPHFTEDLP